MPRVAWTGFGPFAGVADNPSATLATACAARFDADDAEVLEVSAAAATAHARDDDCALRIHLGVAVTYDRITLERCAYARPSGHHDTSAERTSLAPDITIP